MTALTDILAAHREGVSTSAYVRGLTFTGECSCRKFTYDDVTDHDRHVEAELAAAGLVVLEQSVLDRLQGKVDVFASGGQLHKFGPRPDVGRNQWPVP